MAGSRIFGHFAKMTGKAVDISATRHNHLFDNVEDSSAEILLRKITILNYSIGEGGR